MVRNEILKNDQGNLIHAFCPTTLFSHCELSLIAQTLLQQYGHQPYTFGCQFVINLPGTK